MPPETNYVNWEAIHNTPDFMATLANVIVDTIVDAGHSFSIEEREALVAQIEKMPYKDALIYGKKNTPIEEEVLVSAAHEQYHKSNTADDEEVRQ